MKKLEKNAAVLLRKEGKSVKEIASLLKVSQSSVSVWVRKVFVPVGAKALLNERAYKNLSLGTTALKSKTLHRHETYMEEGRALAKLQDLLFLVVCGMYWGEGTKVQTSFKITNCDPLMHKVALSFIKKYQESKPITLEVYCSKHTTRDDKDIELWWRREACLSDDIRIIIRRYEVSRASQLKRVGKQPYGTATLSYNDVRLHYIVLGGIHYFRHELLCDLKSHQYVQVPHTKRCC